MGVIFCPLFIYQESAHFCLNIAITLQMKRTQ